jgi:hypothetical protein
MVCYIVIFELNEPSRLPALKEALKSFSGYCPLTDHSWAIATDKKATEVRDQLAASMGPADPLFVFRSGTEGAWRNSYGEKHSEWLKKNL